MLVKVCGITQKDQYNALVDFGIEMIGINFYPKSKRYVSEPITTKNSNHQTKTVGVFVNPSLNEVRAVAERHNLEIIQLHGNESVELCKSISKLYPVIKAFGIDENFDFTSLSEYEGACKYFLFDTKTKQFGGSGVKFNWTRLDQYKGPTSFLLSGGITIEDSVKIRKMNHPKLIGVDINSGFEVKPGIKNIELIKEMLNILQ
jgi:phosphoribosylanthranilate isomerase